MKCTRCEKTYVIMTGGKPYCADHCPQNEQLSSKPRKKGSKTVENDQLSPKRERFCQQWIVDSNSTQAAIRTGYSKRTAGQQGARLYKNVKVRKRIDELLVIQQERMGLTQDKWIKEYEKIAFLKANDVFHFGESVKTVDGVEVQVGVAYLKKESEMSDAALSSIASIKEGKEGIEIKLHNKQKALDSIGKHYGWLNDKMEHSGDLLIQIVSDFDELEDEPE